MGNSFDYDDTHTPSMLHVHAVTISAALAAAEAGNRAGREAMVAIIAGFETALRVALTNPVRFELLGVQPSSFVGVFGATAAACRAMGLDAPRVRNALGLAGNQASGLLQSVVDGTDAKMFNCGWAAHGGVVAAELASRGYTAPDQIFEGKFGLFPVHIGSDIGATAEVFADLGETWHTPDISFKLHSGCHHAHSFIDAIFELKRAHGIRPEDIEDIECEVIDQQVPIVCEPLAAKLDPATPYGARFSLPYLAAAACVLDEIGLEAYSPEHLWDPRIRRLMERFRYTTRAEPGFPLRLPAHVTVTMADGRRLEARRDHCRGPGGEAIRPGDVERKYRANARRALANDRIEAIVETCSRLDELPNVAELLALARPPRAEPVAGTAAGA
jgi:2-methylcitrate dehydratase PrpD